MSNVPNLDCMTMDPGVLMDFWAKHQRGRNYRELFPAGGKGTRIVTGYLANYASNKATAMQCRLRGDIDAALYYETICEHIYDGLPVWSRW